MNYFREDTDSIDETPARELAAIIIKELPINLEMVYSDYYISYFQAEDDLTEIINNYFKEKEV